MKLQTKAIMAGGIISTTTGSALNITLEGAKVTGSITGTTVAGICANTLMKLGNTFTVTDVKAILDLWFLPANANVVINNNP